MSDAVKWWNKHRNSPGMDDSSKRALLQEMKRHKARDFDNITATMDAETKRTEWDPVFAEDYTQLCKAIEEVEASLTEAG